jgi:hypothetical protein
MKLDEIKDDIDSVMKVTTGDKTKNNMLEAIWNTVCLSEMLNEQKYIEYTYKTILSSFKKTSVKELHNEELSLLCNALIGALLKQYI